MTSPLIANLEKVLAAGRDDALLRFSLGNEYLKLNDPAAAAQHLSQAVHHDPAYSAAWKLLGRALADCGRLQEALGRRKKGRNTSFLHKFSLMRRGSQEGLHKRVATNFIKNLRKRMAWCTGNKIPSFSFDFLNIYNFQKFIFYHGYFFQTLPYF